jgi:DNA-binding transcriptional LysR family regulator
VGVDHQVNTHFFSGVIEMEINPHRLRYFQLVLEKGSIRKAAEHVNTRPSVFTRQIQLLEQEIGVVLFERGPRGTEPTDAAHSLLEYWRGCQAQQEYFEDSLQTLRSLQGGSVHISVSEGQAMSLMEDVLAKFTACYPKVKIAVHVRSTNEIISDVLENIAHIGLAYNPPPTPNIQRHASAKHHVVLAVSPDHPLATRRDSISFCEAISYPYGVMPTAYGLGQLITAIADAENITVAPTFIANSLAVLKQFSKSGNGGTFVTDYSVANEVAAGDIVALPIRHPLVDNQYTTVLVKENRPLTCATRELLSRVNAWMTAFSVPKECD